MVKILSLEHRKKLSEAQKGKTHFCGYDRKNNDPMNLISLCRICHCKTNNLKKREYWKQYYQELILIRFLKLGEKQTNSLLNSLDGELFRFGKGPEPSSESDAKLSNP